MTFSGIPSFTTDSPLLEGNWFPDNLSRIQETLTAVAAQPPLAKPVALFDFDNTCIFRDIGQATFRYQIEYLRYRISPDELAAILPPADGTLNGKPLAVIRQLLLQAYGKLWPLIQQGKTDLARQTEAYPLFATLLLWTVAQARKDAQFGPAFVLPFMGRMLAGFTTEELRNLAYEVVEKVGQEPLDTKVLAAEAPAPLGHISASYPRGLHAYPEIQDLMKRLQACGIERYVISASTEWLVEGAAACLGFAIDQRHIYGIRVRLDEKDRLTIDDFPQYPVTYRQGKTAIVKRLKGVPILVAGDADTDYEMLTLPGVALRLLINRQQSGLIASLYPRPDILLQGIDLARGCFIPSRDSVSL